MSERAGGGRARILVVDDTPANAKLLSDLIERHGYAPTTAASGPEAIAALQRDTYDLVLLDIVMPGMDGYDVCRTIRKDQRWTALPVVMVTALDAREERVKGLEASPTNSCPNRSINPSCWRVCARCCGSRICTTPCSARRPNSASGRQPWSSASDWALPKSSACPDSSGSSRRRSRSSS